MIPGKDNSKSETGTNLNQEMSRIEEKILGVTLPEGITWERIHQSTVRILNILGKKQIEYGELEKFGLGMLITYGEIFRCEKLTSYVRIKWFGSKVNDMADGITWLRRNPGAVCKDTRLTYLSEAAKTCGVTVKSITRRKIYPNNDLALSELRVYIHKYKDITRRLEDLKDKEQSIIIVNLIKADDWADPHRDTSWDIEAGDLEKALNYGSATYNGSDQRFRVIDRTKDC
jgi:hypothetical protein